ncbi:MAG: caspase family protein [Deltaproteobacteria bacterium]|nr:caspase family protein [Deltaproteobacteria bacterium]
MRSLALLLALALPAAAQAASRFAVVLGNNIGGAGRARLQFAEKDAERFQRALAELGDFTEDNVLVLRGGKPADFRAAMARIERSVEKARATGERALLVVYYSGHAGAGGLELGTDIVSYDELKELVGKSVAEAKVVIVDACEAGNLTQVKGAKPSETVNFPLPKDEVKGTAFIASTAVGESAQESVILGGSFFTHHLEVGLRGAADADGDGLVTLAEAFRYTSSATVAATSATHVGPQHPTYDFRMAGRGDVVLADLRRAEARLLVPVDPGTLYVLKGPRGLVAEVPAGQSQLSLGLPAGPYAIERRSPEGRATGSLALARGEVRTLPRLEPTRYAMARAKGGPMDTEWFLSGGVQLVGLPGGSVAPSFGGGVRHELGPLGLLLRMDYAFADVTDGSGGLSRSYSFTRVGASASALYPLSGTRQLLEGGLTVGGGWNTQAWRDGRHFETADLLFGATLRYSLPAWKSFRGAVDLFGGGRSLKLDGKQQVRPAAGAALVLLYGY